MGEDYTGSPDHHLFHGQLDSAAMDMTAALSNNIPLLRSGDVVPVPPINFTMPGVGQRIAASYRQNPAAFAPGGLFARLGELHGQKLKSLFPDAGQQSIVSGIMERARAALGLSAPKATATPPTVPVSRPVATPAPAAPAVDPLAGLSLQDRQEIAAWERHYATLRTEAERDAYFSKLAGQMKATATTKPASAPPAIPTMRVSAWRALTPKAQSDFLLVSKGRLIDDPAPVASRQEDLPQGTLNRASFDKLNPQQKSDHFRSGGKLVD